jgi:uncharacterized protein
LVNRETTAYRGSWLDQVTLRSPESGLFQVAIFPLLMFWKIASLMLLGMALYKLGAFQAAWPRREYLQLVMVGAFVGVPIVAYGIYRNFANNWEFRYSFFFGSAYNYWGSYLVALGWIGAIMLWCQSDWLAGLRRWMAALGRTAFSNYILQSVVCTTIFYGHGLGYFGTVDRARQAGIAVAIYCSQLMIAPLWLRYFRFGPLEWLWRRLTYGKSEPFGR